MTRSVAVQAPASRTPPFQMTLTTVTCWVSDVRAALHVCQLFMLASVGGFSDLQLTNGPLSDEQFLSSADGPQQKLAATLLNDVFGMEGCQFILGMGDKYVLQAW